MEKNKVRNKGISVIIILTILVVLMAIFFYNLNMQKDNELETTIEENKLSNILNDEISNFSNNLDNILISEEKINTDNIYAFVCKHETINEQVKNTLVAINKNDNSEMPIMDFCSGAYDYFDNKIYFYNDNSYEQQGMNYGFYMIDFNNDLNDVQAIYVTENLYISFLEYYDGKLYYTGGTGDNAGLFSFDIKNKFIEKIDGIGNYGFDIDNERNKLYYTNDDQSLCELDLITKKLEIISKESRLEYLAEDKLIYENDEHWFCEYDFDKKTHKNITECFVGVVGQFSIIRDNENYIYTNEDEQLVKQADNGEKEILIEDKKCSTFFILSNNIIRIEEYESSLVNDLLVEEYNSYNYNMIENNIIQINDECNYSYMKKIK